jgi:hypothetical protein
MKVKQVNNYMAMLRNLNNITKVGVSQHHIDKVCAALTDVNAVEKSKQLPFRFFTAYKQLGGEYSIWAKSLEQAMTISCANIPKLSGRTAILVDTSGSMHSAISGKSSVQCVEIASLMGAMLHHVSNDNVVITFDSDAFVVNQLIGESVLYDANMIWTSRNGGVTYLYKALELMIKQRIYVDRIIVLSDMQTYGAQEKRYLDMYKNVGNPNVKTFTVDLQGYSHNSNTLGSDNVYQLAGYSDRIFNLIAAYDQDSAAIVNYIQNLVV